MMITNIEIVPGKRIAKHLGLVQGSSVRAKHVGRDIMAGLKNIFGGELKGYTELLQDSREEAIAIRELTREARWPLPTTAIWSMPIVCAQSLSHTALFFVRPRIRRWCCT